MLKIANKTGASAISRTAQRNPLQILKQLIEADPTADIERLFCKWNKIVLGDEDLLAPVLRHTFTNLLSCVDRDRRGASARRSSYSDSIAITRRVSQIKDRVVSIVLMNVVLPNGKRLRESTFKDCARAGGWFAAIAKKGKPNQVVGRTISEEDLRAIIL